MSTHTDVAHFTFPATAPAPVNGLVVGYAKSSGQQAVSAARRRDILEAYAMEAFGRPLDAFYEDLRSSGAGNDRPGMDALKQHAQEGDIAVIIVEDIDRIARSLAAIAEFDAFCEQMMIKLHTCTGGARDHEPAVHDDLAEEQTSSAKAPRASVS